MSEYPESWVTMALSDAVINVTITDKKIPQKEYLSEGAYPVFDQGQEFIGGYTDKREKLVECELPVIVFGDHTRAIKFVNQPFAAGADGVKVLQPKCFYIPRLFEYFSLHLATHLTSHGYARHYQYLAKSIIPLPPTNEQHRIVAKIEALFSELDKGIESFKTAREQLKIYRQALLKHAFSGKLTEQWRAENAGKLESVETLLQRIQIERQQRYQQQLKDWEAGGKQGSKPKAPKTLPQLTAEELTELPGLPEGWVWVKSGELFESVTSGSRGWAEYYSDSGAIFIRITNLDFDSLKLDLSPKKIQYVQPPVGAEGLRTKVKEGDFLFSITGYLGMFAIAPSLDDAYVNQHISLARPLDGFSKKYFGYYVTSHTGGIHHLNKQTKGAVKAGLGLDDIQNFPVPMCSLNEQIKVSCELESRLSDVDQFDQTLTIALQQADALRQSILKKAFSGQLVPQDPNDEPASVLLERFQAEKAAQAAQTKPNKTQKRKSNA
jgi:type I restriction enzyme S subunit